VLEAMLDRDATLIASRTGIILITDKGFSGKDLERLLTERGVDLLRPARKKERQRWGAAVLKKIRQLIESVNDTLKGQLDLERHGGRTFEGTAVRVASASWPCPPRSGTTSTPASPSVAP
jgi:Transposase DDE domain